MAETKIIVLDDDPTGSQTVHGCLLLTRWDVETLMLGLQDDSPLFFILTNTRGMSADDAATISREVCVNLREALAAMAARKQAVHPVVVSRSDSTLRGHYPVETDIIAEQLGPFDAHFMIPAFFEGGRFTRNSIHYLLVDGKPVPVHETEFARDSVFSYTHSYLPDYVEEKTAGRIKAEQVERFVLEDVRGESQSRLMALENNQCCVVDCENQEDLNHFCQALMDTAAKGKRYLFRSAASLLTALARLPPQPVPAELMHHYVRDAKAGAVIVGSHVSKTTQQLNCLLQMPGIAAIEVEVDRIEKEYDALLESIVDRIAALHASGKTVVIFTSREERAFTTSKQRLEFGIRVSSFLMAIVKQLPTSLGFLISKGGITSNDVLSEGLSLQTSRVLGQILPGCSVVRCPDDHSRYPDLPVVVFPGNVGDENSLARACAYLTSAEISL